jgi:organic hydroperoxide reductase OsmC/OhrA
VGSIYEVEVRWRRQPNERFVDGHYSRAHEWLFDGGARVHASSSPHVVKVPFSDPSGIDPEEAFLAAISSCHMLFFLGYAAQRGFVVAAYDDRAIGVMSKDGTREWMAKVTLHPNVEFAGDKRPTAAEVDVLHHQSHADCYIANSVKSEIVIEGRTQGLQPR